MSRGPAYVNPLDFDDTELGAAVRAAYAEGHNAVLFPARSRNPLRREDYETTDEEGAARFERDHALPPEPEHEPGPADLREDQ